MVLEKRIDDMIEAGWHVLASDFAPEAFDQWRAEASKCLSALLGPDHTDTRWFTKHAQSALIRRDQLLQRGIATSTEDESGARLHTSAETEEEH